jgi:prepilin-type N-terminal cleavage/methylation domain-containing protein
MRTLDQKGLTLTEITVVMVLASIVMPGLVGFYMNSQATWTDAAAKAVTQREGTALLESIAQRTHGAGSALATNPDGNPDHAQLDLFAQPSQQNQFYSFWWDAADSRVHEGPSRTQDRGASVTSTVERFNLFTTDSMVVLNSLVLRSPQGERVRLFTNVALLNR